jgi:hypothetical protein
MSALDYTVEPEVDYPDSDANVTAFVWATATIGGRDAVEEFLACGMYPLASSFSFLDVAVGTTASWQRLRRTPKKSWVAMGPRSTRHAW